MERGEDEGAGEAADAMESDLEQMEERSEQVQEDVEDVRHDWERKQQDSDVPGAEPPEEDEAGEVAGDGSDEGPGAGEAGQ